MDLTELMSLNPKRFENKELFPKEILAFFDLCDAYWQHNGDPKNPHAELTSGNCSNGFFNCLEVLKYVNLSEILANQLARKIRQEIENVNIGWVIASPMAGITFGHDVARALGAQVMFFTEKDPKEKGKMLWNRVQIPEGEIVLQIEELITTAKTLNAVQEAVDVGNKTPVNWLPVIGSLVHRPEKLVSHYGDRKVISLIETEIWNKKPEECPLCEAGSKRLRPKLDNNWNILTGKI